MLARYFTVLAFLLLMALIIRHLLNRRQKKALGELISLTAKVILIVSIIAAIWRLFIQAA